MNRRWRLALMWLLLLALPLQGFAAATMLHCAPNHHAAGVAAMQEPVGASMHSHAGHGAPSHDHGASHAASHAASVSHHDHGAAGAPGDAAAPADASPAFDTAAKAKCSACASCCFGAALPAAPIALPACVPDAAPSAVPCDEAIGFVTDGPDRPPRLPLA